MDAYMYTPLKGELSFRLLYLQGGTDPKVSIQLEDHDLNEHPTYEALSYTWHTPEYEGSHKETMVGNERTQSVLCNNQRIFVTPNCESALLQLRYADKPRVLWVDAICIDQGNIPERNQQVLLMQRIYAECSGVLCWLGEDGSNVSTIFDHIKTFLGHAREVLRLEQLPQDEDTVSQRDTVQAAARVTRSEICIPIEDAKNSPLFYGMSSLHQRSYWDRVWILQEVRAAPRRTLICGQAQMNYDDMLDFLVADYILNKKVEENDPGQEKYRQSWVGGLLTKFMAQEKVANGKQDLSALQTLSDGVPFLSTDPRDKVYALIGLSDQLRELMPTPDYSQTVQEVYTSTAAAILNTTKALDLLYWCFGQACEPNLPCWVPDWSSAERPWWKSQIEASVRFQAAKLTAPEFEVQMPEAMLKVKGMIIDKIDAVNEFYSKDILQLATSIRQQTPRHLWDDKSGASHFFLTYPYAIWRQWCITSNKVSANPWAIKMDPHTDSLWYLFSAVLSRPELHHGYEVWREILEHEEFSSLMRAQYIAMIDKVSEFDEATRALAGLTLCHTIGGRLALVPHAAKEGDDIALVAGCSLPFLIRPTAKGHKLIGASYVHGIMHGEALAGKEDQMWMLVLTGDTDVDPMAKLDS